MGSTNIPEGLVKKETMIIAALVTLVVGFLGGVFFSSFRAPMHPAPVAQSKPQQPPAGQQQAGPTSEQAAQIFALEEEVKANPKNVMAWTNLGNLYFDTDQPNPSIAAYLKSLELNPSQPNVLTDLGIMYRHNRQFKDAIAVFDKALGMQPDLEQALFNKGVVLIFDLKDKAAGLKVWQQVLSRNPNAQAPNGQPLADLIASVNK